MPICDGSPTQRETHWLGDEGQTLKGCLGVNETTEIKKKKEKIKADVRESG